MKNLKKFVAAFAAAAMVMSIGVSAFADVITPDVNETKDQLILNVTSEEEQITMMAYLVPATTTADAIPEYSNQEIIALNQDAGATGFASIPIDAAKLTDEYSIAVKIGGSNGGVATYLITYNEETGELEFTYGDVDGNGTINASDASWVLTKFANSTTIFPCEYDAAGDVDGNGTINASDASWILTKFANSSTVFPVEAE